MTKYFVVVVLLVSTVNCFGMDGNDAADDAGSAQGYVAGRRELSEHFAYQAAYGEPAGSGKEDSKTKLSEQKSTPAVGQGADGGNKGEAPLMDEVN